MLPAFLLTSQQSNKQRLISKVLQPLESQNSHLMIAHTVVEKEREKTHTHPCVLPPLSDFGFSRNNNNKKVEETVGIVSSRCCSPHTQSLFLFSARPPTLGPSFCVCGCSAAAAAAVGGGGSLHNDCDESALNKTRHYITCCVVE